MSKRYTSTITVTWEGNMLDAKNIEEYIKKLKQFVFEEFNIHLNDTNINNVKEIPFTKLSKMFKEELNNEQKI
jgi:ABC-type histidine transport system ATPase subunit